METPNEIAAERLAWEMGAWNSIELRMRHDFTSHKADPLDPPVFDRVEEHYIETALGQRYYETLSIDSKSDQITFRLIRYGQEGRSVDVTYDRENTSKQYHALVKRAFANEDKSDRPEKPIPHVFYYVGRKPLYEVLPEAEYIGTDQVLGRDCEIFRISQVQWHTPQDLVYHLDKETSIPLKIESYRDEESRVERHPQWVWTADAIEQFDGHPVVVKSTQLDYTAPGSELSFTRTFQVQSISFNKDYPESMFWPDLQPGITVFDTITGKTYPAPGDPRERQGDESANRESVATTSTSSPLQALPPSHWTSAFSTLSLGLGISVLLASLTLIWWRRR